MSASQWVTRIAAVAAFAFASYASGHENTPAGGAPPYSITPVLKQAMSDPALAEYELLAVMLEIVPGGVDTAPHRHDADLFVYVVEGAVEVELQGMGRKVYRRGEMFHEPRNALHSLLRNVDPSAPAKALGLFVIAKGRQFYVPAGQ